MKLRIALLALVCLTLAATASAQLYDNGPANGTTDAWTINFGYVVSNNFRCCKSFEGNGGAPAGTTMTGFDFAVWEFPGDTLTQVDWSVTSGENSGTVYGSGTASVTDSFISTNQYGYNIDKATVSGLNVGLTAGNTYWLNLQNASVASGDPVYWDENSGAGCKSDGCPSSASESALGTIPSEAFTIEGSGGTGTTPEPGSIMLFGSGLLGVAGILRRKLGR